MNRITDTGVPDPLKLQHRELHHSSSLLADLQSKLAVGRGVMKLANYIKIQKIGVYVNIKIMLINVNNSCM